MSVQSPPLATDLAPTQRTDGPDALCLHARGYAPFLLDEECPADSPYGLPVGTVSDDGVAVVGQKGWLYVSGGSNHWHEQYTGTRNLSAAQVTQWQTLLANRQQLFSRMGMQYLHLTVPDKQCVHPQWAAHPPAPGLRPVKQLAGTPAFLYPLAELQEWATHLPLWLRGNSHWNVYGCYLTARVLLEALDVPCPAIDALKVECRSGAHDLTVKFMPAWREPTCRIASPAIELLNNRLWEREGKHLGNHYILKNDRALTGKTICVFGDSYTWDAGLGQLLSYVFNEVHFIWSAHVNPEYCRMAGADVVITETAERNMILVPNESYHEDAVR
ncbi:hypothetical protein GCM10025770_33040 [Viridibacterium curvum]|uniref:AlgX/AlgJ SGNH hydrolase-like domain-containing protein n=2 Tax=Viridibacterium curvum TaxID=1101404 RepID=A0ABP9R0S1_9RHOO